MLKYHENGGRKGNSSICILRSNIKILNKKSCSRKP
nr:MAG TPA: hypothetical protein [Caudoviricetes sp.]